MTDSLRRLGDAMQLWFEHRAAPGGSDAELLQRHPELRDLLEPLLAAAPPAAEVRFGEFRLEHEIGRGGMGVVHAAVQESLGRRVALKVLAGANPGPQAIGRFRRESELLARLRHEHLVQVFEAGMADGVPWFAMEFVDGCSLAEVMQKLRTDPTAPANGDALAAAHAAVLGDPQAGTRLRASSHTAAAVQCLLPIGDALAFAHRNRVLHRDVKPANILLRRCGTPLLGDFGLARDLRDPSITATGNFAGTPHYVAPEQVAGGPQAVDERADVFALGVVLYELLLLQRPFDGASSEAVLHCVQHTEPPALAGRSPGLSADVAAVLEKALQKRPQDRYASMADFVADLRCLLAMQPVRARRSGPVARWLRAVRRQPLRAALLGVAATSLAGVAWLSAYLWTQQPRLAAANRAERIPRVEALLEEAMLARHAEDDVVAAAALRTAERLLPDLPEIAVERLRQHGAPAAVAASNGPPAAAAGADFQDHLTLPLPTMEPITALGWFVRGTTALEAFAVAGDRGHLPVAAKALRHAIDRAAAPRAIYHCQLLRAQMLLGDHDGVRNLVGDIQHRWPGTPFATFWCGTALLGLDPERAIVDVRRTLAGHPHHPHLQALLAQLLVSSAPHESIAAADAAIAARPDWVAPRLIKARALLEVGQATAALAVCDEARAMAPRNASAMAGRGRVLGVLGRFDEAIEATDDAIRTAPHAAHPHVQQAFVRARQGRPELALAAAERAVAAEPFDPKAIEALGTAQWGNGRYADAAATFGRLVQLAPRHANAWLDLGSARVKCGEWDAAETALRTASQLRPDDGRPHLQLGLMAAQRRDLAAAEACFRTALQCAPGNAEARLRLAALLFQRREFAAGLQLCSEARQLTPTIDQGYTLAIRALQASGQTPAAIDLQVEYCQQRPGGIGPRLELCELLLAAEPEGADLAPAVRALDEAEASEPGRGDVAFWRGELALRNDDPEAAAAAFAAAAAHPATPAQLQTRAGARLQQLGH